MTAPTERVVLELESPPALVGRIVSPTTGDPIERPYVTASWSAGSYSQSIEGRQGKDGSFRIAFEHGLPERVVLSVGDSSGAAMREYVVTIPLGMRSYDAGAFAIAEAREVAFRVVDHAGVPVPKAEVVGSPGGDFSRRPIRAVMRPHCEANLGALRKQPSAECELPGYADKTKTSAPAPARQWEPAAGFLP